MSRDTRDTTSRDTTQRRAVFENIRDIPAHMLPADMDVLWVTEEVYGEYQHTNIMTRMNRDGYTALTTDDIPALRMATLPGREQKDTIARWGGQVLMGRPKVVGDEARAEHMRETQAAVDNLGKQHAKGITEAGVARDREDTIRVRKEIARPQFQE